MRRAGRVDGNQAFIVEGLRKTGVSVALLSSLGGGIPDLLCGFNGRNFLIEVKDATKPKSDRQLTPAQVIFFRNWRGQVAKVETLDEALMIIFEDERK